MTPLERHKWEEAKPQDSRGRETYQRELSATIKRENQSHLQENKNQILTNTKRSTPLTSATMALDMYLSKDLSPPPQQQHYISTCGAQRESNDASRNIRDSRRSVASFSSFMQQHFSLQDHGHRHAQLSSKGEQDAVRLESPLSRFRRKAKEVQWLDQTVEDSSAMCKVDSKRSAIKLQLQLDDVLVEDSILEGAIRQKIREAKQLRQRKQASARSLSSSSAPAEKIVTAARHRKVKAANLSSTLAKNLPLLTVDPLDEQNRTSSPIVAISDPPVPHTKPSVPTIFSQFHEGSLSKVQVFSSVGSVDQTRSVSQAVSQIQRTWKRYRHSRACGLHERLIIKENSVNIGDMSGQLYAGKNRIHPYVTVPITIPAAGSTSEEAGLLVQEGEVQNSINEAVHEDYNSVSARVPLWADDEWSLLEEGRRVMQLENILGSNHQVGDDKEEILWKHPQDVVEMHERKRLADLQRRKREHENERKVIKSSIDNVDVPQLISNKDREYPEHKFTFDVGLTISKTKKCDQRRKLKKNRKVQISVCKNKKRLKQGNCESVTREQKKREEIPLKFSSTCVSDAEGVDEETSARRSDINQDPSTQVPDTENRNYVIFSHPVTEGNDEVDHCTRNDLINVGDLTIAGRLLLTNGEHFGDTIECAPTGFIPLSVIEQESRFLENAVVSYGAMKTNSVSVTEQTNIVHINEEVELESEKHQSSEPEITPARGSWPVSTTVACDHSSNKILQTTLTDTLVQLSSSSNMTFDEEKEGVGDVGEAVHACSRHENDSPNTDNSRDINTIENEEENPDHIRHQHTCKTNNRLIPLFHPTSPYSCTGALSYDSPAVNDRKQEEFLQALIEFKESLQWSMSSTTPLSSSVPPDQPHSPQLERKSEHDERKQGSDEDEVEDEDDENSLDDEFRAMMSEVGRYKQQVAQVLK